MAFKTSRERLGELTRKQVRYHLYRLKNEALGGSSTEDCKSIVKPLLKFFKELQWFDILGGIEQFSIKWDVSEHDPLAMAPRDRSVLAEWHDELEPLINDLPVKVKDLPLDDQPPT